MLKYVNTGIVFQEIPDEVTLSINISNCPCRCPGCHSRYLWGDIGEELSVRTLEGFVREYGSEITCLCFMGGDSEPDSVCALASFLRQRYPALRLAWYSGRQRIPSSVDKSLFDYLKVGPYLSHLGPLKSPTTNQHLYKRVEDGFKDITSRFWKEKQEMS